MVEELIENLNGILKEKNEKIKPENIREGIQIFDVTGEFKGGGFDNIEETAEYQACLLLANSIEVFDDYTGTTATPEDVKEGKIAYSNGKRIVGTYNLSSQIVVSADEPTGENRKKVWLQKVNNLTRIVFVQGSATELANAIRVTYYGNYRVKKGQTYTFSTNIPDEYMFAIGLSAKTFPVANPNQFFFDSGWQQKSFTFTPSQDGYLAIIFKRETDNPYFVPAEINGYNFQLELGSAATEYREYIEPKLYMLNENNEYVEVGLGV